MKKRLRKVNILLRKFNYAFDFMKSRAERINNDRFKINLVQTVPFWIASLLVGLVAVGYAQLFSWAESLLLKITEGRMWILFILAPVCYILAREIVVRFGKMANGSGIPQVIVAIGLANPKQYKLVDFLLSFRIMLVKIVSSLLMVFGGAAVGREGPTIQISGSIFWSVFKVLPRTWAQISKRNIIITGAAAGLAAAFNTPLGGIVFAVEELSKTHFSYFKTAIFTAVIISGLTAQWISGPYLYLGYPAVTGLSPIIMLFVLIVALAGGAAGTFMAKIIIYILDFKARLGSVKKEYVFIIFGALIMATVAYFFDTAILGSGKKEMLRVLFENDKHAGLPLVFMRILGPMLSYSAGGAGGVFAPALSAGAVMGAWIAGICDFTANNANILILSGMVAFLTGVTKSPFTSAILVLEMTDRHNVIFHLMTAAMIANVVSGLIDKNSFYSNLEERILKQMKIEAEPEVPAVVEE